MPEPIVTPKPEEPVTPPAPGTDEGKKGPVNQEAIDRIYKKQKETEEALARSEQEKVDLVGRVKSLEDAGQPAPPITPPLTKTKYGFEPDGSVVYPATQEEWEDLYDESPMLATDLRVAQSQRQGKAVKAQIESIDRVAKAHPEMFKKDENGNILRHENGVPMPDNNNPKYKRYCEIAAQSGVDVGGNPVVMGLPDGPEIVALKMEKELYKGKEDELTKKAEEEKAAAEEARKKKVTDGSTAPPGGSPPPPAKVEVKFNSPAEKEQAEEKVRQGVYKDTEEYCRVRDSKEIPYGRGGI